MKRLGSCAAAGCGGRFNCAGGCELRQTVIVELPWSKPPLRANDRRSWQAQARSFKQALTEARWAVKAADLEPIVGAEITLHYRPKTRRIQDADGIAPTLKPVIDALVHEGILPADDWVHVPRTSQRIHPPDGEPAVWLELDAITYYEERPA